MQRSRIKFKLYRLSKMIPIFCIVAFLGICVASVNPMVNQASYALEGATENTQDSSEEDSDNATIPSEGASDTQKTENTTEANEPAEAPSSPDENNLDGTTNEEVNHNDQITPQADGDLGSASITITATDNEYGSDPNASTLVPANGMAYRSHQVAVDVNEVTGFSLKISYASGKDALRLDGDTTYMANADGKTPNEMAPGSWGFAWGNADADETTMPYYTMPQFGAASSDVSTGLLEHYDTYQDAFTKKLVFGAKFGAQNRPGHYTTQVMLSLVASAQQVVTTLKDLTYMHEMTPEICASTTPGETKALIDWRDGNSYTVMRLQDGENMQGNCWMLQNLKLTKESIESWKSSNPDDLNTVKLTSKYSNVADGSSYTLPASSQSSFNTTSNASINATFASTTAAYGTYYSWCAATAGTCSSVASGGQEASASVCPKGWRLPTSNKSSGATGYNYSFNNLVDKLDFTNDAAGSTKLRGEPYNFQLAGRVYNGSLGNVGSNGHYWSSTASSSIDTYYLYFSSSNVNPSNYRNFGRYYGVPVRCVAPAS